jgi:hypothetical protein
MMDGAEFNLVRIYTAPNKEFPLCIPAERKSLGVAFNASFSWTYFLVNCCH